MKIGLVEKILIALAGVLMLGSLVFAVVARPKANNVVVLKTLNMTCGSCSSRIETALAGKPGVVEVTVAIENAQVVVAYDAKAVSPETLAEAVTAAGFKSAVVQNLSLEQYRSLAGQTGPGAKPSNKGGCGGSCCN